MSGNGGQPPEQKKPNEDKQETRPPHIPLPGQPQHIITRTISQEFLRAAATYQSSQSGIRPNVSGRPIAPAPITTLGATIAAGSTIANPVPHAIMSKLPKSVQHIAAGMTVTGSSPLSTPPVSLTLQTTIPHVGPSHISAGGIIATPLSAVPQTTAAASAQIQGAPGQVHMASIIRGPPLTQPPVCTSLVMPPNPAQPIAHIHPPFSTHVPRGAVAASQLAAPKPTTMATAVQLRPSAHPGSVQLPVSVTGSSPALAGLHQIQPRPLTVPNVSAIRPGTPPSTRPGSPHVGATSVQPAHVTDVHSMLSFPQNLPSYRPLLSQQHSITTAAQTPVQITIQQTRPHEVTPRPLLAQHAQTALAARPLNIAQSLVPQQPQQVLTAQHQMSAHKVMMSQATVVPNSQTSVTSLTTTAKTVKNVATAAVLSVPHSIGSAVTPVSTSAISVTSITPTVVSSAPSIPVAKVQPQPQLPLTQSQPHEFNRDRPPQQGPQGPLFLPQAHRGSPNPTTTALSMSSMVPHVDNRSDRPGISAHGIGAPPGFIPPEYNVNYFGSIYVPQLMTYHQQVAAAAQALAPMSSGTSFRPGLVPNQTPNLATALQAAAHNMGVSSAPGVRINPLMVTVDPTRHHTPMSVHASFPTTSSEGTNNTSAETGTLSSVVSTLSGFSSSVQSVPSTQTQPTPLSVTGKDLSASPRPSILRKRTNDGTPVTFKKNLSTPTNSETSSPMAEPPRSATSSPKHSALLMDPSRENSQSSTDTATSTENTPSAHSTPEVKIKEEPPDSIDNVLTNTPTTTATVLPNSAETSPRKKPRKQLLNATVEEMKDELSTDEEVEKLSSKAGIRFSLDKPIKKEGGRKQHPTIAKFTELVADITQTDYVDNDGIKWTVERQRPNISLLNHYNCTWKAQNNHFLRHTDVKPKDERRPTVNELSNQKGVLQKISGWRLYHLASQLEEMKDAEREMFSKMTNIQDEIAPKTFAKQLHSMEDDIGMVHELTQGNIQRCQLVIDQLDEAKTSMIKLLDHKQRITEIINKHHSKRPVKKKERS